MPYLSIITPTLNQASYLEQAIASVVAQDFSDVEHIVIDGGSTDGTVAILERHQHLRWTSEADRGQADAINKGIAQARGEIIGILNGDDYYAQNVFGSISAFFQSRPCCQVMYGDICFVDFRGRPLGNVCGPTITLESLKRNPDIVRHPSTFVRRSLFDEIGYYNTKLKMVFDFEFLIRAAMRYPLSHLPKVLSNFRMHEGCKSLRYQRRQALELLDVAIRMKYLTPALAALLIKKYLRGVGPLAAAIRTVKNSSPNPSKSSNAQ